MWVSWGELEGVRPVVDGSRELSMPGLGGQCVDEVGHRTGVGVSVQVVRWKGGGQCVD